MTCGCRGMAAAAASSPLGFGRAATAAVLPHFPPTAAAPGPLFTPLCVCLSTRHVHREAFQSYIAEDAFFLKSFGERGCCCWDAG